MLTVAPECLGKVLVVQRPDGVAAGRIVEVEAYRGPEDRAAHSFGGRHTARNHSLWCAGGVAYVFLVYGLHWHLNLVTGLEGEPQAVLIRGVEPLLGLELMRQRRGPLRDEHALTSGPGKLARAFGVARDLDGAAFTSETLFLLDGPRLPAKRSARIGVDYAGAWARRPWRYFVAGSPWVSRARTSAAG